MSSDLPALETSASAGLEIVVRPCLGSDVLALTRFFEALSRRSLYQRYHSFRRASPVECAVELVEGRPADGATLVALGRGELAGLVLGVAQVAAPAGERRGEFALVVLDGWQGRGIGAALLSRCLDLAREGGLRELWGLVSDGNEGALRLARGQGFEMRRSADVGAWRVTLKLAPR